MEQQRTWDWLDGAVEMIPFGLLAVFYGEKEIRITKLAEEGFCFRVAGVLSDMRETLQVCFYDLKRSSYQEIFVRADTWIVEEQTEFFTSYAVAVQQEDYRMAVQKLFGQYDRYICLKLEENDSGLAEQMTGYPAKEDEAFADSLEEQLQEWIGEEAYLHQEAAEEKRELEKETRVDDRSRLQEKCEHDCTERMGGHNVELALELDRPALYRAFLEQDPETFFHHVCAENGVLAGCFRKRKPDRLYIGNAFCHLLFPEENELFSMLEKARREGVRVTLTCSYVREFLLEKTEDLIGKLEEWCGRNGTELEIVVNDWGMADLLKNRASSLKPCLGVLLNKRKKDPRMPYKKGNMTLLKQNSLNAEFYQAYLEQEFGIHRFEWESCGYAQQFPSAEPEEAVEHHLHMPFYQTNTSQYCTLYAGCEWGDRGRQRLVMECDKRCEKQAYLYPKHLHMAGRYNSLFGFDTEILKQTGIADGNAEQMEQFCREHHVSRLVFPCWQLNARSHAYLFSDKDIPNV